MCIICKTTSVLHLAYIKKQGGLQDLPNLAIKLAPTQIYKEVMEQAMPVFHEVEALFNNNEEFTLKDHQLGHYAVGIEGRAFSYASKKMHLTTVKLMIEAAKEVDALRTALTMIQSCAVIADLDVIKKIADDALNAKRVLESSSEYQAKLVELENAHKDAEASPEQD